MRRRLPLTIVLALALAGCGGGGGSSESSGSSATGGSGKTVEVSDAVIFSIVNCLIDANWSVQPTGNEIAGTSERGVLYLVKFYPTIDEAKAKAGEKGVVVDNAVVQLNVTGMQNAGGVNTPVKPTTEHATITDCIEKSG